MNKAIWVDHFEYRDATEADFSRSTAAGTTC